MKIFYTKCAILLCFLFIIVTSTRSQVISTFAGGGSGGDGSPASTANIGLVGFGCFDGVGNYYFFQDFANPKIRMVDASGIIHTIAGNGTSGYGGDGGPATSAQFHQVNGLTVDLLGNVYISDLQNYRIRKVNYTTHIINTIAGIGTSGYSGDGSAATAAKIIPGGICVDTSGNIYFLDNYRIRKIHTSGIISTIAGTGAGGITGYTGDGGPATAAEIGSGIGICADKSGNLYFGSSGGIRIRKVNLNTGTINTIAGNGISGTYNGEGIHADSAQFSEFGICRDVIGNIFISDYGNQRVRKIDTFGIIRTVAGTGVVGFSGDGGLATNAQINRPEGVAVDACGNLYIADDLNRRIRKVTFTANPTIALSGTSTTVVGSSVTLTASVVNAGSNYSIKWFNKGVLFSTTTVPSVTYTKSICNDSITAVVYGCNDSAVSNLKVVGCNVGVASLNANNGVKCYPNPVLGELHIEAGEPVESIIIANLLGQVVFTKTNINTKEATVSMAHLPKGIYLVRVACPGFSGGSIYVERVVKE